jgi:hypothetical protein
VNQLANLLGPEFATGFPTEVESGDHVFVLDYDGDILSYARREEISSLFEAAEALTRRLEACFA